MDFTTKEFHKVDHPWNMDMKDIQILSAAFSSLKNGSIEESNRAYEYYYKQLLDYRDRLDIWLKSDMESIDQMHVRGTDLLPEAIDDDVLDIRVKYYSNIDKDFDDDGYYEELQRVEDDANTEISMECKYPMMNRSGDEVAMILKSGNSSPIDTIDYIDYIDIVEGRWRTDIIKKKIKKLSDVYLKKVDMIIRLYELEWKVSKSINVDLVIEVGLLMGELICGKFNITTGYYYTSWRNSKILPILIWDFIYPILNHTGHFAYNSFLYAFFNGIIIYGIPSNLSVADTITYCPKDFVEHDISHTYIMTSTKPGINISIDNTVSTRSVFSLSKYLRVAYENLLSKYKKISYNMFELGLFSLWFLIHEAQYSDPDISRIILDMKENLDGHEIELKRTRDYKEYVSILRRFIVDPVWKSKLDLLERQSESKSYVSGRQRKNNDKVDNVILRFANDYFRTKREEIASLIPTPINPERPVLFNTGSDLFYFIQFDIFSINAEEDMLDISKYLDSVIDIVELKYPSQSSEYFTEKKELLDSLYMVQRDNRYYRSLWNVIIWAGLECIDWSLVQEAISDDYGPIIPGSYHDIIRKSLNGI